MDLITDQCGNGFLTFSNGKFYGMTLGGGVNNQGTIYEWDPVTNIYGKKFDFNTDDGGDLWIANHVRW